MSDANTPTGMPIPDALAGNFQDAVRWFNQMWAGADPSLSGGTAAGPIPSMMMPTLDIKELDKRIADLRSVEQWLQLNQGLLRTTIQGLEMQRNTLAAWKAFGASAGASTPSGAGGAAAGTPSQIPPFQPAIWWTSLQEQFAKMAASASAQDATGKKAAGAAESAPAKKGEKAEKAASAKAKPGDSNPG